MSIREETRSYPAPLLLTGADQDAIVGLLEKHVEGRLTPNDIRAFFTARASQQLAAKPAHPRATGYSYGHWGNADGSIEIFAHSTRRFDLHAGSTISFIIASPDYRGAVWADRNSNGAVEFTALGMPDDAFAGFAYGNAAAAHQAIEHQITHHVTGQCRHDHAAVFGFGLRR